MEVLPFFLCSFIVICAIAAVCTRKLLTACIVFMCLSIGMCIVWILLESPDLAITEAAVGAGVSSLLLFVTLKKIHAIDHAKGDDLSGEED